MLPFSSRHTPPTQRHPCFILAQHLPYLKLAQLLLDPAFSQRHSFSARTLPCSSSAQPLPFSARSPCSSPVQLPPFSAFAQRHPRYVSAQLHPFLVPTLTPSLLHSCSTPAFLRTRSPLFLGDSTPAFLRMLSLFRVGSTPAFLRTHAPLFLTSSTPAFPRKRAPLVPHRLNSRISPRACSPCSSSAQPHHCPSCQNAASLNLLIHSIFIVNELKIYNSFIGFHLIIKHFDEAK